MLTTNIYTLSNTSKPHCHLFFSITKGSSHQWVPNCTIKHSTIHSWSCNERKQNTEQSITECHQVCNWCLFTKPLHYSVFTQTTIEFVLLPPDTNEPTEDHHTRQCQQKQSGGQAAGPAALFLVPEPANAGSTAPLRPRRGATNSCHLSCQGATVNTDQHPRQLPHPLLHRNKAHLWLPLLEGHWP